MIEKTFEDGINEMNNHYQLIRLVILILIVLFFTVSQIFDWVLLFQCAGNGNYSESFISRLIRLLIVVTAGAYTWISVPNALDKKDSVSIRLIFSAIVIADILMFLFLTIPGIFFFLVIQVLLIRRNSKGFTEFWKNQPGNRKKRILAIAAVIIVLVTLAEFIFLFYPVMGFTPMLYVFIVYAVIIGISVWAGIYALVAGHFPKENSRMICAGMILFYICDVTTGFNLSMPKNMLWQILTNLVWVFYTPAIILLAFSGSRYKTPAI